jgi:ArsR family transcriptional regulator, lead/cadmium/zinc/bismuth-responsive transcriptional repressor
VIDAERICQAIAALDPPEAIQARARQYAVLADPTRLTLLLAIKAAAPISVSDLAAATGINDATVSQTLRYLRASQTVLAERQGRVVRYRLAGTPVTALL